MKRKIERKFPKLLLNARKLYYYVRRMKILFRELFSYIIWIFPIQSKKIVIVSYFGKNFGDNGLYITKEILSRE